MQRVRVGLTGLAVVLLLVALTTVFVAFIDDRTATTEQPISQKDKSEDEPLSDLGVVPRAPDNSVVAGNITTAPAVVPGNGVVP
jgi:hypothetical protein